jgi:hypothetical protein
LRATVKTTVTPNTHHPIQADGTNARFPRHSATAACSSQAVASKASNTTNGFIASAPGKSAWSKRLAQRVPPHPGQSNPVQRLTKHDGKNARSGNTRLKTTLATIAASATPRQMNRRSGMNQG